MFPTQSKVSRTSNLWLLPVIALAMLLVGYAVFAASTAQAQTPAGDVCIEGIVIDWEENPLAGWVITLTSDITGFAPITTSSAFEPEDDDVEYGNNYDDKGKGKKYNFEYPDSDDELQKGEFEFTEDDIAGAVTPTVGVQAGIYTATIETRPGWEGVTPTTISFPIEVGQDDCVKIRFKMRRIVVVTAYKINADHEPLGDWTIRAIPGPGNLFASPQEEETSAPFTVTTGISPTATTVISGGSAVFTLTPGLWIFTEQAPKQDEDEAPEHYVPIVPSNGRQELLIPDDLDPDTSLQVVFKNELVTGCFVVRKVGLTNDAASVLGPSFNVAGWGFKLLRSDGSVARQGVTDGLGEIRFDNLPLGPYTIVEEDRPGWNEVSADQLDINVDGNLCTDPEAVVEFLNEQDDSGFCIEGRKIDANGGYGIFGWEITIEALDEGGALPVDDVNDENNEEVDTTLTNGLGEFTFNFERNDYRVPGAKYEVCESEQDGWLAHNPTCQTVRLPEWPGACIQLNDFVNQQVGHSESQDKGYDKGEGEYHEGDEYGKGGYEEGPSNGGPEGEYHEGGEYGKGGSEEGPSYGGPEGNHEGGYGEGEGAQCSSYHVVKAGEGLYTIGNQYQKSAQQMLDANPSVRDGDQLWVYEGQRICIP